MEFLGVYLLKYYLTVTGSWIFGQLPLMQKVLQFTAAAAVIQMTLKHCRKEKATE